MKATLRFELPDEMDDFKAAVAGSKNKMLIDDLYDNVFRKYINYDHPILNTSLTDRDQDVIMQIWNEVNEHFNGD